MLNFEQQQRLKILQCYSNTLEKGGEGSRGGKIIGHTRSGLPIYQNSKEHQWLKQGLDTETGYLPDSPNHHVQLALNELRNEKSISRVKFRKIVESLKSKGVDKKDIKSGLYNIRFGHTIGMSGEDINKEVDLHFEDRQPRVHPKVRASRSPYRGPAEGRRL